MPGKYELRFNDFYHAVVLELNDEKIIFSKVDFISYLTQVTYRLSRIQAKSGYFKLKDDQLLFPKGIHDYAELAHTITPKRQTTTPLMNAEHFVIGFKISVGDRLIIILNNSNRYAYDCGEIKSWKAFFKARFDRLTTVDMYFIWFLNKYARHRLHEFSKSRSEELVAILKEGIKEFNLKERKSLSSQKPVSEKAANFIADFLIQTQLDCLVEVSYREVGLIINDDIKNNQYSDAQVSQAFRNLINGDNAQMLNIRHLPLLVVITMISEYGRNYNATITNLMLLELMEAQHKTIATQDALHWVDAVIPNELYELNKQRVKDEKSITKLANIGGYFCMSHTSSFYENVLPLGGTDSTFTEAFYLQQALIYNTLSPQLISPPLYFMLSLANESDDPNLFTPNTKPNVSKEKSFMIVSEWLSFRKVAKILSKKQFNNLQKNKNSEAKYVEGNLTHFMQMVFPLVMLQLGFDKARIKSLQEDPESNFNTANLTSVKSENITETRTFAFENYIKDYQSRLVSRMTQAQRLLSSLPPLDESLSQSGQTVTVDLGDQAVSNVPSSIQYSAQQSFMPPPKLTQETIEHHETDEVNEPLRYTPS